MDRIRAGLARYAVTQLIPVTNGWDDINVPVTDVAAACTVQQNEALLVPVEGRHGKEAAHASIPLRTLSTRSETGLLTMPFVMNHHGAAATELLIRAVDGRLASADRPWIKATKHGIWIDFADVENHVGSLSGGEQRLLRIAASIGSSDAEPVFLGDVM